MAQVDSSPLILRLGGSIVSHSNKVIDFDYLREFRDLLRDQILLGRRFIIVLGGGQTYREYRDLAMQKGNIQNETDLHYIGIAINNLHAEIVRAFLGEEITEEKVWKNEDVNYLAQMRYEKPVAVAGGFLPGRSSDWAALQIAKTWGVKRILDLKNIDGVYSADPRTVPGAKHFPKLSWDKYMETIGNVETHEPGAHFPVDAVAAKESKELGVEFVIIKATDLPNIENAINEEDFRGTVIKD